LLFEWNRTEQTPFPNSEAVFFFSQTFGMKDRGDVNTTFEVK